MFVGHVIAVSFYILVVYVFFIMLKRFFVFYKKVPKGSFSVRLIGCIADRNKAKLISKYEYEIDNIEKFKMIASKPEECIRYFGEIILLNFNFFVLFFSISYMSGVISSNSYFLKSPSMSVLLKYCSQLEVSASVFLTLFSFLFFFLFLWLSDKFSFVRNEERVGAKIAELKSEINRIKSNDIY